MGKHHRRRSDSSVSSQSSDELEKCLVSLMKQVRKRKHSRKEQRSARHSRSRTRNSTEPGTSKCAISDLHPFSGDTEQHSPFNVHTYTSLSLGEDALLDGGIISPVNIDSSHGE